VQLNAGHPENSNPSYSASKYKLNSNRDSVNLEFCSDKRNGYSYEHHLFCSNSLLVSKSLIFLNGHQRILTTSVHHPQAREGQNIGTEASRTRRRTVVYHRCSLPRIYPFVLLLLKIYDPVMNFFFLPASRSCSSRLRFMRRGRPAAVDVSSKLEFF